jgi:hypothetical protein
LRQAAQAAAQALLSLIIALALVMLLRRSSGALLQPLPAAALPAVAVVLAATAAAVRASLFACRRSAMYSLPGLAAAALLAAVTLSGTPPLAIASAWFIFAVGESLSWLVACRPEFLRSVRTPRPTANQRVSAEPIEATDAELPAGLVQQLTRIRENGHESIHAVLFAEIDPGDRQTALHVAFCPPLETKPELTAHALDADEAEVRITQAETFGARIEVRLPAVAAGKQTALVELLGSATSR